jgi:hypothetical protein
MGYQAVWPTYLLEQSEQLPPEVHYLWAVGHHLCLICVQHRAKKWLTAAPLLGRKAVGARKNSRVHLLESTRSSGKETSEGLAYAAALHSHGTDSH